MKPSMRALTLGICAFLGFALSHANFAPAIPGDLNCDGNVNLDDVEPFVLALVEPDSYPYSCIENADLSGDGTTDGIDLHPFVDALLSPPTGSCCQPNGTCTVTVATACTGVWTMFGTCTPNPCVGTITPTQLAGNSLSAYPYFEYVRAFNVNATVQAAIDPTRFPEITGHTCDVYIVAAKTDAQWLANPTLTDVTPGGALTTTFSGSTIQGNTVTVATANQLSAAAGTGLGVGYDLVIDVNRNGNLDSGDYIDGLGSEAGLYMVHDTTAAGPLAVTEFIYSGGSGLGQDTYYPTTIASLGQLPLIVISHGNGHNYRWYDHIGNHMASYGYIVMSHENNTGPGIETASISTLTNTDYIIANQGTIGGGVLNGHIDSHRITWIGHSRGAEGITRAFDRMIDGTYTPSRFSSDDILLLSSMLPTDFLGTSSSNPHAANYHLWTASGDADVNGSADCDLCQTFHLHGRATRFAQSTTVQGAGHGDFHDGGGSSVADGPCLIGRATTHLIQKGYFLPLIKHYIEGNIPATDFLWRQYERFHPIGVDTSNSCIVVTNEYRNGAYTGNTVIDDYQTQTTTGLSSSGGAVAYTVENLTEGRLDDNDSTFTWSTSDPFNGATQDGPGDSERGVVFDWNNANRYYEWAIIPAYRDFSDDLYISFRGAQGTQHPYTLSPLGDKTFSLALRDGNGISSSINIGAYGGGLEQPYQRDGGWHNEMETIRMRLTDFLANGSGLDLTNIVAVRLNCGPSWGNSRGRIVIDNLMLTNDGLPNIFTFISIVGGPPDMLPAGTPTVLDVDIITMGEAIVPGSELLHYRYDGGVYQVVPMTLVGPGHYQATLPAPSCTDTPQFHLSAEGSVTGLVTDPPGAPGVIYTSSVGAYVAFYTNLLDTNPGWTAESMWAFGTPTGQGGAYGGPDPTSGHTGTKVYGYNLNGDYEDSLATERKLTSTVINCAGRTQVHLSFWRWLGIEPPFYDHARLYVSNNGTTWNLIWENDTTYDDGAWVYVEYDISSYADNQSTVYLRWTLGTTDSLIQYCGWNIDDLQLSAFICD